MINGIHECITFGTKNGKCNESVGIQKFEEFAKLFTIYQKNKIIVQPNIERSNRINSVLIRYNRSRRHI